jgi:hypothetical protein
MSAGFPDCVLLGSPLPEETRRTLQRVIRLPRTMEARGVRCPERDH